MQAYKRTRGGATRPLPAVLLMLALAQSASADTVDEYIAEARSYFANGQLNAAVIQLKNALQEEPNSAEARYLLGIAYLQIGDVRVAEKELRRASELGWRREQVLVPLARVMLYKGEPQTLLREIKPEDDDPEGLRSDLLALRGLAQLALERVDAARESIAQALSADPEGVEAVMASARLALLDRDFELSLQRLDQAITLQPQRVEALLTRAQVEQLLGRHEKAIETFDEVLALRPASRAALVGRANSLLRLGQTEAAMSNVEQVLTDEPRRPDANFIKAQILAAANDLDGAEAALSRVRLAAPDHLGAQLLSALVFYRQNSFAQAEDSLERFLKANPQHLPALKLMAATLTRLGRPGQAVQLLQPLLDDERVAADAQFYALLGNAQLQDGDSEQGAASMARAIGIAPEVSELRTQLALSHLALGQTQQAISELETAVDLGEDLMRADLLLITTHLRNRDVTAALAAAEALIERRPEDPLAYNLLGAVHMSAENLSAARAAFERQLALQPDSAGARLNLAKLDVREKNYDAAERRYRELLDDQPNELRSLLGMAQLAKLRDDTEARIEWLLKAWQAHPEAIHAGALLVDIYLQRGERLRALSLAREVQSRAPENAVAVNALGRALLANDEVASAVDNFEVLAEQVPQSASAWLQLALAQMRSERWRAAELSFGKVLEISPEEPRALAGLGRLDLRARRYRKALERAERLKTLRPEAGVGYTIEADALFASGDLDGAARAYRQALERQPRAPLAMSLASVYLRQDRLQQAIEVLREWLQREPQANDLRVRLAGLLERSGDAEGAIEQYEQVLARDESHVVALNNLAWLYISRDPAKGLAHAQRASELAPGRAEITDTLGWALVHSGELERGLRLLQQAAIQAPNVPDIRYHLAVAYHRLGRTEDAVAELQAVVEGGREFGDLDKAKALLARLRSG